MQLIRKTIEQQQPSTIQFKSVSTIESMDIPKNEAILKNVCFLSDDNDVNMRQSNTKYTRQISKEPTNAPKKNLPHKKRITKKLKSISPTDVEIQMQLNDQQPKYQLQLDNIEQYGLNEFQSQLETHQQHQPTSNQNVTLNLALNSQPIQLTTKEPPDTAQFLNSASYSSQTIQMPAESNPVLPAPNYSCELCGMEADSQLAFFNHLKLHYEPNVTTASSNNIKMENIGCNMTTNKANEVDSSLNLERSNQNVFQIAEERKSSENHCISIQTLENQVVDDGFAQMQDDPQDFSCMANIGTEDANEDCGNDDSINDYADSGLNCIKSEQNEFSDPEDMLESGVLDKVQRVVDSYIENGSTDVKNLIGLSETSHHHPSLVNNSCEWATPNQNVISNHIVYSMDKANAVANTVINSADFTISTLEQQQQQHQIQNQSTAVNERTEDDQLTLIYEINMDVKDFSMMEENSTES